MRGEVAGVEADSDGCFFDPRGQLPSSEEVAVGLCEEGVGRTVSAGRMGVKEGMECEDGTEGAPVGDDGNAMAEVEVVAFRVVDAYDSDLSTIGEPLKGDVSSGWVETRLEGLRALGDASDFPCTTQGVECEEDGTTLERAGRQVGSRSDHAGRSTELEVRGRTSLVEAAEEPGQDESPLQPATDFQTDRGGRGADVTADGTGGELGRGDGEVDAEPGDDSAPEFPAVAGNRTAEVVGVKEAEEPTESKSTRRSSGSLLPSLDEPDSNVLSDRLRGDGKAGAGRCGRAVTGFVAQRLSSSASVIDCVDKPLVQSTCRSIAGCSICRHARQIRNRRNEVLGECPLATAEATLLLSQRETIRRETAGSVEPTS